MPKETIYLYVEGYDLEDSEAELTAAFTGLVNGWKNSSLSLVNDRRTPEDATHPEDFPEWFLGLNVNADAVTEEDLEALLRSPKTFQDEQVVTLYLA